MKNIFLIATITLVFWSCTSDKPNDNQPDMIPAPVQANMNNGSFKVSGRTEIVINSSDEEVIMVAEGLRSKLSAYTGKDLSVSQVGGKQPGNSIFLKLEENLAEDLGEEGYQMSVKSSGIEIIAPKPAGLFYGVQTIYQLLPSEIYSDSVKADGEKARLEIPCVEMTDYPAFSWRGMHLDVSRHFFPKEFVKKYIDLIALHKMNVFHWHLTDDNGWRIEIMQYPKLTEIAAWRADREGISWTQSQPQKPGEQATYGGFYTQDDIREIVEYARQRFITVIPEIEMPGHTSEVFAAYPELSCTGERTTVQTGSYWPNSHIFCAGKEETFRFLENVIDEVAGLFPAQYIHIGGDEADKTAWRTCPKCQSRIRSEGLANVDELQSYFVKRIEKHLHAKGKRLIGWDEILEGGLAPDATVMSWRGFEGGIEAANQGHEVVMCPTSHCYFDYYQADAEFQPPAIGGLITLKKVYSFRPIPSELQGAQRDLILGGQGNLWTEYISTPSHAEYMALPRMTALAEVLWSPENKLDWDDFSARLKNQFKRFDNIPVNYSKGSGKVEASGLFNQDKKQYSILLSTETEGASIYYSLDGDVPDANAFKYNNPIEIDRNVTLKAISYNGDQPLERYAEYKISNHKILGNKVQYQTAFSERYPAAGIYTLNDGIRGSLNFNDGYWQGFHGKNMDVVIELGDEFTITNITSTFLLDQKKWIFIPDVVNYYISEDGQNYQKLVAATHKIPQDNEKALTNDFTVKLNRPLKTRFLRVEAVNIGVCPEWHSGKGQKSWIFIDEIVVN